MRPGPVKKARAESEKDSEHETNTNYYSGIHAGWQQAVKWVLQQSTEAWATGDEKKAHALKDLAILMKKPAEQAEKHAENIKSHNSLLSKKELEGG